MKSNKIYSIKFVYPKRWVNKFIKVEADNLKDARELLLKELAKINKRFTKVYEVSPEELKNMTEEVYVGKKEIVHAKQ